MDIEALIELARKKGRYKTFIRNKHLVKDWWPKPQIRIIDEMYWGTKHTNNRGILHKYECFSFSRIGFGSGGYRGKQTNPNLPENICLAYGETPEEAYDHWCEIFNAWNDTEDWVK